MRSSNSITVDQNMNIVFSSINLLAHISRDSAGPCTHDEYLMYFTLYVTMYSMYCALYMAKYSMHFTLYMVMCSIYCIIYMAQYTLYFTLYIAL